MTDSSVGKESACNAGNPRLIPGSGRFPWRRDRLPTSVFLGFPGGSDGKESTCNVRDLGLIPWRRAWQPTPVFLPGESPGHRSLEDYRSWGRRESDMTEQLSTASVSLADLVEGTKVKRGVQ